MHEMIADGNDVAARCGRRRPAVVVSTTGLGFAPTNWNVVIARDPTAMG
jgi:hypothetical protein